MTDRGRYEGGFAGMEERYAGYAVYDADGGRVGAVDDLFLDENDQPEYIGVRKGLTGAGTFLIPVASLRVDDARRMVEVPFGRGHIEAGPAFVEEGEITPEFEREALVHYGVVREGPSTRGGEGAPRAAAPREGSRGSEELRVQRSEEELRAGTREREAGAVRVRKRVRTDRERIEVPTRREEVTVERVPVSGGTTEARIGDEELVVPVVEEEVVVEKRPVVKEEVRIRKDVVEGTEVVEDEIRREEIEVEDATRRRRDT